MFNKIDLRRMINLKEEFYQKFITNYTNIVLANYRGTVKTYTYTKIDQVKSSPFLKDKIITMVCDGDEYEGTHGNVLSVLILFTTLNKLVNANVEVEDINDYIFDSAFPASFENALDNIYSNFIEVEDIKNIIFTVMSKLAKLSAMFVSGTMSLRDIYQLRKHNPEFEEILNFSVSESSSFASMIQQINDNKDKLQEFLTSTDSAYRPMILSNCGFNFKQASQIFNLIGPKPDVFGNIHTHAILTNFLNGLESVDDFYVNADNCRKALITNFTAVKDSGYLTRILSMLCLDTKLSDTDQCNTAPTNLPNVFVRDEFILNKYKNRNMWNGTKYIKVGTDSILIGQTIKVASPMTCSCEDGICKNCYGELYKTISSKKLSDGRTIKINIGLIAVLLLTEVLTQSLLSTKHLLEAKTDEIEWKGLNEYFEIFANDMMLNDNINLNTIQVLDTDDDDNIVKLSISGVEFETPVALILNKMFKLVIVNETDDFFKIEVNGDEFTDEEINNSCVFNFVIKNKELSDPLNKINSLLNSNKIKDRDLDENINYMMELLDIVGFDISSEHIEVIMRELVKIDNRKDFECENPKYEFIGAKSKVLQDSVTKSLLFERLETQLLNINTYYKLNEESLLDFLL